MGDVTDCPRSCLPVKVPDEHYRCIYEELIMNEELTDSALKDTLIQKFGADKIQCGVRTIAMIRNELG